MRRRNRLARLLTLMIITSAIGALGTSGIHSAYAMNSPSVSADPAPMIVGTGNNKITVTSAGDNTKPHTDIKVEIGEPTVTFSGNGSPDTPAANPPANGFPGGTCTLPAINTNPNTRSVWVLRDAATGLVDVKLTTGTPGNPGSVSIPFTSGIVAITSLGGAVGVGNPATAQWVDIVNAAPAAINFAGTYATGHCGYDGFGTTGSVNQLYGTSGGIPAQLPVGGEVLTISATALLLAGMSTNALWLLPLVAVAGGSFAVLRYQVTRK